MFCFEKNGNVSSNSLKFIFFPLNFLFLRKKIGHNSVLLSKSWQEENLVSWAIIYVNQMEFCKLLQPGYYGICADLGEPFSMT